MFYSAIRGEAYESFLSEDTELPMMHIDDLVTGTVRKKRNKNFIVV